MLESTPVPESGAVVESRVGREPEPVPESERVQESERVPESEPVPDGEPTRLRMRRAPRYLPFGVTGTGLGVAVPSAASAWPSCWSAAAPDPGDRSPSTK